ncbi:GNAT family N-acetyltransferase [Streptomyces goshikiensis]|uniref:GNAT family N-acetyltransferase n=1 Tax=Streptomyces goshikiensis TaxID=1942 RepID=UPI00367D05F2
MTAFTVRVAAGEADRAACFAVRTEVFVIEQSVPESIEYDAYDAVAVHVLAEGPDGAPLGTGRLLYGPEALAKTGSPEVGSLGRLAVTKAARGLGVGVALVRAIEAEAGRLGLAAVDLGAQTHALGFYERLGYEAYGPEFQDASIPHRSMRRRLP